MRPRPIEVHLSGRTEHVLEGIAKVAIVSLAASVLLIGIRLCDTIEAKGTPESVPSLDYREAVHVARAIVEEARS